MNPFYPLRKPLHKAAARFALLSFAMLVGSLLAQAQIVFDGSPGSGAPPATLGGYTMTAVPGSSVADNTTTISSVASPLGGTIGFSPSVITRTVPATWNNWSHGFTGRVYDSGLDVQTLTLTLPANTKAFYFYAEGSDYSTYNIMATTNNGGSSGMVPVTTPNGAKYFGFYVNQPGVDLMTITITVQNGSDGFAVGEFGISQLQCPTTPITPTASNGGVLTCTNPSSTITAPTGGTNYAFTGPGNFSQSGAGNTASVSAPGTYTVVETQTGGCRVSGTITIGENKTPPTNVTLSNDGPLTCTKTSVTLTASSTGGSNYAFSGPNNFSQSGAATTASVTAPGTYSVVVTGTNGCSATAQTTTVSSDTAAPAATLSNDGPISANKTTVTLTASTGMGYTYAFSSGANQQGGASGNTATVTSPGAYQVTVTGTNGCTAVGQTTVVGGNSPTVCRGGTGIITVVASGNPAKYEWYKNSTNSARLSEVPYLQRGTTTSSLTLINAQITADYYVKVTDANGSVVVYGPFRLTVDASCRGRLAAEESVEPSNELRVSVLGNPLSGETLRAIVRGAEGRSLRVELLDLSGRPLHEQRWASAADEQVVEWNLSTQSSGVYVLQAVSGGDAGNPAQRHSLKVVKP